MTNMNHEASPLAGSDSATGSITEGFGVESIYKLHGGRVYSLCLRLLSDRNKAEDATAEAFVRFHKELGVQSDGPLVLVRLRQLGIEAALRRLRAHGGLVAGVFQTARRMIGRKAEKKNNGSQSQPHPGRSE